MVNTSLAEYLFKLVNKYKLIPSLPVSYLGSKYSKQEVHEEVGGEHGAGNTDVVRQDGHDETGLKQRY